jgi:hypothetical protein
MSVAPMAVCWAEAMVVMKACLWEKTLVDPKEQWLVEHWVS